MSDTYPRKTGLVIIGAGIVGCSVAYHLALKGYRDAVVLEQGPLFQTGGSTSHAPGLVFQTNGSKTMAELAKYTVQLYSELELDGQPCFYATGSIEVAHTRERWDDLHRKLGWARSWGIPAEMLTPTAAHDRLPLLDPAMIQGGFSVPSDGIAKPVRACEAMARVAQVSGIQFFGDTTVTGFEISNGQVRAVITNHGRIEAERVLICAGIWGPRIGRLAGVTIPLTPVQHQYVRTTPLAELSGETQEVSHPILRHQDRAMYFRQHGDCYGIGSYQHEPLLVDADDILSHRDAPIMPSVLAFTPEHFSKPWNDAVRLLPALGRTKLASSFNGMFSFTPDGLPILGEFAKVRGLWSGEAVWITHGGGVGRVLAEWLVDGVSSIDLRECDINRWEDHALSPAYIKERGAQQYREVYDILHPLQQLERPRPLRVSPFHERMTALGAMYFEGRGWERPQWFAANEALLQGQDIPVRNGWAARCWSPISGAEHLHTREHVALYDMTPLTKAEVAGPGALSLIDHLVTNRVDRPVGSIVYTAMLDPHGGIKSDLTIVRRAEDHFQLGLNGPMDLHWIRNHASSAGSVYVREITSSICALGLWGPRARDVLQQISPDDLSDKAFRYFTAREIFVGEVPVLALRLSYVGELGWELYAPAEYRVRLWDLIWEAGQSHSIIAGGRGAFDSLRLEKGYRLWGNDMHTEYNPYEAGLGWTVNLDKGDFIGREALIRCREQGITRRLCCLTLDDPEVVVLGKEPIWGGTEMLGYVTSANYGYSVGASIAYGYLPIAASAAGTKVEIEYFGQRYGATVSNEPLWDPKMARMRGI